jgi:Uma2 family endonuclease
MQRPQVTLDDYLLMEEHSETKHEYWDGYVVDMAGAPWGHVRLTARLVTLLNIQLKGCRAVSSDLRVRIGTRYAYPDVVVVCGEPRLTDELPESLLNPTLLVEVTSDRL